MLGLWLLSLLGFNAAGKRTSLAAVLCAVRRAAHGNPADRTLRSWLRAAVRDDAKRRAAKTAWRWPHKKNPAPPGRPRLATATPAQIRLAAALRSRLKAA